MSCPGRGTTCPAPVLSSAVTRPGCCMVVSACTDAPEGVCLAPCLCGTWPVAVGPQGRWDGGIARILLEVTLISPEV